MIDKENITWDELEERAKAGDKVAIEYIENVEKEMAPQLKSLGEALVNFVDGLFEDHPSKPFFEQIRLLRRSENPVHRAIAREFSKWSLKEIQEKGAKYLEEELSKSASDLPIKINPGRKSGARKPWKDLEPETQEKYSTWWNIYLIMIDEYKADELDGQAETSKVTVSDWRTRIITAMEKGKNPPGERTLETVKSYGIAGNIPTKKTKK